jgi:hypothetical protein
MRHPRELGPIPPIRSRRRLNAMAIKKREVCLCDSCVAAFPERGGWRERRALELRAKMNRENLGAP